MNLRSLRLIALIVFGGVVAFFAGAGLLIALLVAG